VENQNYQKLLDIIATLFELDPATVTRDTSPDSVQQWDSLNHVNLCTAVCEEFQITMTTDEMTSIRNVGDLIGLLNAKGLTC
jgi:acyl carrier protein